MSTDTARTAPDEKLLQYGVEVIDEIERRGLADELAARRSEYTCPRCGKDYGSLCR